MTPRERSLKAIHHEIPDRVPVMPGYGPWYASRIFGIDLFDIEQGKVSVPELMSGLTRKYGCEGWLDYQDAIEERCLDSRMESSSSRQEIDDDHYMEMINLTTPAGTLTTQSLHSRHNPQHTLAGWLKTPEDWRIYRAGLGEQWEWGTTSTIEQVPEEIKNLGIAIFGLCLPVDFWKDMRHDTAGAVMDMYDGNSMMEEAMEWHCHHNIERLKARLMFDPAPDMIHLQGSSSSLSVISPDIYKRYNVDHINQVCDLAHAKGVPVQVHHCGRSAKIVDILYEMTSLDVIHPLEPLPGGDVDLKVIKKKYGDRFVFMGNINTYHTMLYGTPQEVKETARKCIEDAAEGGGFILTNGDQIGRDTPEENVIAMVEAAYEYGVY
ncbi:MAG: uroporphyrinogen decarboxylase family protein [Armatimonadota bacterium]